MFGQKNQETQNDDVKAVELLGQQLLDVRGQMQQLAQKLDKFIEDSTSALNVLDNDVLDLKEKEGKEDFNVAKEVMALKKRLDELALVGKLALDNDERLSHVEFVLEKKFGKMPELSPKGRVDKENQASGSAKNDKTCRKHLHSK